MAATNDMTNNQMGSSEDINKNSDISERIEKLEKNLELVSSENKTPEEQEKFIKDIVVKENEDNINKLKDELSNTIDEKIDEKIEKNNINYNNVMLEQNLKNFKEISSLRKGQKDLEANINENISNSVNDAISQNNIKYDELLNNLDNKLDLQKEEQIKFFEEEKENINKLQEELYNTIDEKIEKNNINYNNVMLEQNLKNFKEISSLRKGQKDLEENINENINNSVNDAINQNNAKYDELINNLNNKLDLQKEEQIKFFEEEKDNFNKKNEELLNNVNDTISQNSIKYEELINNLNSKLDDNSNNINKLQEEISNKIDEKLEQNNINYNSVMLEQNLKTFKEISGLRKN
ncbi:hypothetical protein R4K48_14590, partial [Brachyspira pulli]